MICHDRGLEARRTPSDEGSDLAFAILVTSGIAAAAGPVAPEPVLDIEVEPLGPGAIPVVDPVTTAATVDVPHHPGGQRAVNVKLVPAVWRSRGG